MYFVQLCLQVSFLPAPAKERWDGTADAHEPGEGHSSQSMVTAELKGSKRFADDQISLERQDSQGPGRHQSWKPQKESINEKTFHQQSQWVTNNQFIKEKITHSRSGLWQDPQHTYYYYNTCSSRTCYRSHGRLQGTHGVTQEVITLYGGDEHLTDGEGDEDEPSDGDVDQDVVERDAQLLVLDCHEENNKV